MKIFLLRNVRIYIKIAYTKLKNVFPVQKRQIIMIREKLRFQNFINVSTDVLTIFISYVLAVFLRYEVMNSKPGLDTLSAPYLLIAAAYSIILASIFQFMRTSKGRQDFGFEVLPINAIGSLFLLAFFYMIGETYFSRLALIMYWLLSSILLEVKWIVLHIIFNKKHLELTKKIRVLVIGGGEVTREYISSVGWDDACGFNIIGYIGKKYGIFFDYEFDRVENNDVNITERGWLGEFDQFETVLDREKPDEVVFALEDAELYRLPDLLNIVEEKEIKSSIVTSFSKYIPRGATVNKISDVTAVDLSDGCPERTTGFYGIGLTLASVFLLLLLIIRRFHIGTLSDIGLYENYRCLIFAVGSFLGYLCLSNRLKDKV